VRGLEEAQRAIALEQAAAIVDSKQPPFREVVGAFSEEADAALSEEAVASGEGPAREIHSTAGATHPPWRVHRRSACAPALGRFEGKVQ